MEPIDSILQNIENQWESVASEEIERAVEGRGMTGVYVAAFWLFYVDYSAFYPPYLSVNAESAATSTEDRWSPPEWGDGLDDATDRMAEAYEPLVQALEGESDAVWDCVIGSHYEAISRVCKRLTKDKRGRELQFTNDFVACILDPQSGETEYNRLVRMSIADEDIQSLDGLLLETENDK